MHRRQYTEPKRVMAAAPDWPLPAVTAEARNPKQGFQMRMALI